MSRVVILMGSPSDLEHSSKIAEACSGLGVEVIQRIGSAHRVPEHVLELLRRYDADETPTVFITVAGMSDALSGVTDAAVASPVIACPPKSSSFAGLDVLSSLRTPPGVSPAVALEPRNAALMAAKILGLADPKLREAVGASQRSGAERVLEADRELGGRG